MQNHLNVRMLTSSLQISNFAAEALLMSYGMKIFYAYMQFVEMLYKL